jgi:predicted 3-demethylubiquinone-9 3-methyltransferase (glyoxalase superfamily)
MNEITPCLWFDTEGEEAAKLYTSVFPNSKILDTSRYGEAGPRPAGTVMTELLGDPDREKSQRVMAAMLKMKKIDIGELERAAAQT